MYIQVVMKPIVDFINSFQNREIILHLTFSPLKLEFLDFSYQDVS